jgi:hypothetical protein
VSASIAKQILDLIKKGDIEAVRVEAERLGNGNGSLVLPFLHDDKYHHNAIFYATLIKDEASCIKMIEYLIT